MTHHRMLMMAACITVKAVWEERGVFVVSGGNVLSSAMTMKDGTIANNTSQLVWSGGTVTNYTFQNKAYLSAFSGALISGISLGQSAYAYCMSGATMVEPHVNNSQCVLRVEGGVCSDLELLRGQTSVYSGGAAINPRVLAASGSGSAYLAILSSGACSGAYVSGALAGMHVGANADNASAVNTVIDGGTISLGYGIRLYDTLLTNSARMIIYHTPSVISGLTVRSGAVVMQSSHVGAPPIYNMVLSSGGTASSVKGGCKYNGALIHSGGVMHVAEGSATSVTVENGGSIHVSNLGSAINMTLSSGGSLFLSMGGIVRSCTFYNTFIVSSNAEVQGGYASNALSTLGLALAGAKVSGLTLCGGPSSRAFRNFTVRGYASGVHAATNVQLLIAGASAHAYGTVLSSSNEIPGGYGPLLNVTVGGHASGVVVWGGYISATSGNTTLLEDVYVSRPYAAIGVLSSALARNISGEAPLNILLGGRVENINVSGGAASRVCSVYSGGTLSGGTCGSKYTFNVNSASLIEDFVICSGGSLNAISTGIASGGSVLSGGSAKALSGGSILDVEVFGRVDALSGGSVISPAVLPGGLVYMYAGGSVVAPVIQGKLQGGGNVNAAVVSSGASLFLLTSAYASDVSVLPAGSLNIQSGASAVDVTAADGALITVSDGGYISYLAPTFGVQGVFLRSGTTTISSDWAVVGGIVSSGQTQYVFSKGSVSSCTVLQSGIQHISSGGVAQDCDVSHFQYVFSGGTAIGTIAHYRQYVSAGGSVIGTIVKEPAAGVNAALNLPASAWASGVTVSSNGTAWIQNKDAYDFTISSGGYAQVYPNATVSGVVVEPGGRMMIQSGATALAVLSMAGASVTSNAGAHVEFIKIIEPTEGEYGVFLYNGAGTVLSSAMSMGGNLSMTASQVLRVFESGVVDSARMATKASIYVSSGGTINYIYTNIQSGYLYVADGGCVESMYVSQGKFPSPVTGGGIINILTTVSTGLRTSSIRIGHLIQSTYGGVQASSGTVVSSADIYGNHFHISSGATALAATVYNGGHMSVWAGGTAYGVVNSNGDVVCKNGGVLVYA